MKGGEDDDNEREIQERGGELEAKGSEKKDDHKTIGEERGD